MNADQFTDQYAAPYPEPNAVKPPLRGRRIWKFAAALLFVLALLLTPPLLNMNRLRRRITVSMSQSLGRPVHLDNVTLTLLPVPGFTLENLVVSEDPSFGSEPVIRANVVRANLRFSSLWRRQVEFASIKFGVDDRGSGPSVNLVRRADGRWNLESILLHAAQTTTAPTAQQKAGPAPRFPYIEATGARINIKSGDEKLPFALTEADFALWLPSPEQWRVRLDGRPMRTDVPVSDTGTLQVEATLQRAAHVAGVPLEVTAHWKQAPLGEMSRVLHGADAGWRGGVETTATLNGTLGNAHLSSVTRLRGLRRADFIPQKELDLDVRCESEMNVAAAQLTAPQCQLSKAPHRLLNIGETDVPSPTLLAWSAAQLDLTTRRALAQTVDTPGLPLDWLLDVARLFSQRIPAYDPAGMLIAHFAQSPAGKAQPPAGIWTGSATGTQPVTLGATAAGKDDTVPVHFVITAQDGGLALAPLQLPLGAKGEALTLGGTLTRQGYRFALAGAASSAQLKQLQAWLPPLGDGLASVVPPSATTDASPARLDFTCTRTWGQPQTCAPNAATPAPVRRSMKPAHRRR
jgi:AsmA protein